MATLAIIAGQGRLPVDIAKAANSGGDDVCIFAIRGQADADFSNFLTHDIDIGSISKTRSLLIELGCEKLVMAGKVERPSLTALRPDTDALKLLGKALTRGDDSLLRLIAAYFAEAGIVTIAPDNFLTDRNTPFGLINQGVVALADCQPDIDLAVATLTALSPFDVGQAVIVQQGRVIAIEGAEGSDAMIARAGGLLDTSARAAVLVKIPKQGQDLRLDMPVFGLATIETATAAGVGVIGISAGGVLLADPLELLKDACNRSGITLVGLA